MVSTVKIYAVFLHRFRDTFPAVTRKYCRVRNAKYVTAFHIRMFFLCSPYLFRYMVNRPLHTFVRFSGASVQLRESIHAP